MPDTIGRIRREARAAARDAGVPPRDVDLLLADVIERDPIHLLASDDQVLDDEQTRRFDEQLARRLTGEPVQYIRGHCEFFGRTFHVDPRVLIPRPETELLCEQVLRIAQPGMRVLDVGCGSGAIAVTLALERPSLRVLATDISIDAIVVARANARRLSAPVSFVQADLLSPILATFSLIVSNPPYVPAGEVPGLQREVASHEPHLALSGGSEGLDTITRLTEEAGKRLDRKGALLMEIGWDQGDRVRALGEAHGFSVDVREDLAGLPRCAVLRRA